MSDPTDARRRQRAMLAAIGAGLIFFACCEWLLFRAIWWITRDRELRSTLAEAVAVMGWLPLGAAALWVKNRVEDWLNGY